MLLNQTEEIKDNIVVLSNRMDEIDDSNEKKFNLLNQNIASIQETGYKHKFSKLYVKLQLIVTQNESLKTDLYRLEKQIVGDSACIKTDDFDSKDYWESRYQQGNSSGSGSTGRLAEFKAETINKFCSEHDIQTVVEWGCGDGNQLSLMDYPDYLGLDVSGKAIDMCKKRFLEDSRKRFMLIDEKLSITQRYDLALSLDVIFHLVEDKVFHEYMDNLFSSSKRYVCIYSNDTDMPAWCPHMRFRKFSSYISQNFPKWQLYRFIPNKYSFDIDDQRNTSIADFYIYRYKSC